jgi:hypothetical protein
MKPEAQRGQVLLIFALAAFFLIGVVALAVDYGLLADHHRNLQAAADDAALAAARQLSPSATATLGSDARTANAQTNARRSAYLYLRDAIDGGAASPPSALQIANLPACWGTAPDTFTADVLDCSFSPPYETFHVTICAPGEASGGGAPCATQRGYGVNTVSVRISQDTETAMAGVIGASSVTVGGFALAEYDAGAGSGGGQTFSGQVPLALYSGGCVTTGAGTTEQVQGEVYIDTCGRGPGGGLCALATAVTSGDLTFGPSAPAIASSQGNQTQAACTTGGTFEGEGAVGNAAVSLPVPRLAPPPTYPTTDLSAGGGNPVGNGATLCSNGHSPARSDCFTPGVYNSITGIHNNLNPGVYYILGDERACPSSQTWCPGVSFAGDTLNANYGDVAGGCWTVACMTGFKINPHDPAIVDGDCSGACASPGFDNVPALVGNVAQDYGVTFVLFGRASFCLVDGCGAPAAGTTRTVMLSPACLNPGADANAAGSYQPCVPPATAAPCDGSAATCVDDGAYTIYGPTQGIIQVPSPAPGAYRFGGVGTIYAPSASLQVTDSATFELVPGQAIVHDASLSTANGGVPDIFFPCCTSLGVSGSSSLVGAQRSPAVHLIR